VGEKSQLLGLAKGVAMAKEINRLFASASDCSDVRFPQFAVLRLLAHIKTKTN
jgi:hypothetical protein